MVFDTLSLHDMPVNNGEVVGKSSSLERDSWRGRKTEIVKNKFRDVNSISARLKGK